jgi:hypothetical protein
MHTPGFWLRLLFLPDLPDSQHFAKWPWATAQQCIIMKISIHSNSVMHKVLLCITALIMLVRAFAEMMML